MDAADWVLLISGLWLLVLLVDRASAENASGSDTSFDVGSLVSTPGDFSVANDTRGGSVSISDWAQAVFHVEGGNPQDRNVRNNNPGNLKAAPDQFTGTPTQRDSSGFVIFPSMDAGWAALNAQLQRYVNEFPDFSLTQITSRYLGQSGLNPQVTSEGDPFSYASRVAAQLGVSADSTLSQLFGGN